MATLTLSSAPAAVDPSDADLLNSALSLLSAVPGPRLTQPLSDLLGYVCSIKLLDGAARAVQLEQLLAEYLHERHALLRTADTTPAGVDAWAARAHIDVVRAAIICCARRLGGGAR
ncbi:hypothetical protein ACQEVZ_60590 [Dactylosporangium sp. CA-152071]|uniref:hypothetical protein n=1 Tax=Dactylosporangium sp. CA-152071 TaxID=3239933 RepID=UPI003D92D4E7